MGIRISSLSIFFALFLPLFVHAAPSYTVAPLVIDTDAKARDIITKDISITNTGTQPVTIYPSVNNISLDEGGTIQEFLPPVESDRTASLASWIEISRRGIDLAVGESTTVTMTLRVNPNPEPGEYHAFLGFGNGRNRDVAEELVRLGRAPGVVVTVNIIDDKQEYLKLTRFLIDRFITSRDNQSATYIIDNPGDETLIPGGEVIFYDNKGIEVASLPVNPDHTEIPPGGQLEFTADVPTDGMFGKHKAFLSVEYGSQLASVQDTVFFYVFPLKTVLIGLGIVSLLVVILALYLHKRYFGDAEMDDDSDFLPLHVRETHSDAREHDIDLKKQ